MASPNHCEFSPDLHHDLTVKAAGGTLQGAALERVADANRHQDRRPLHSQIHVDNCAFAEGVDYINEEWRFIESQKDRFSDRSLDAFGRLLHTVQDFYSHSNWVEVFQLESPIPVWDLQIATLPKGIVSGTWKRGRPKRCGAGAPSHEELNKDGPDTPEGAKRVAEGPNAGKTLYDLALDAAFRATAAQFTRFTGNAER